MTTRTAPDPELSWHPDVDWPELQAIWARRDTGYRKFWRMAPTDEMVMAARERRATEAMGLGDVEDRATAYIAAAKWDPRSLRP